MFRNVTCYENSYILHYTAENTGNYQHRENHASTNQSTNFLSRKRLFSFISFRLLSI